MAYVLGDTTTFLADVRRLGALPATSSLATANDDLLAHADAELREYIVPLLMRCNEEYLTRTLDVTLTAGTASYELPRRAVGSRLRDVHYLRSNTLTHIPRLRPEQSSIALTNAQGYPYGFYLEDARLVLLPAPSAADSLRIRYYVRPGKLVLDSTAGRQITAVTADTPTAGRTRLTFATFSTFSTKVDVTSHQQPFETRGYGLTAANVTTTTLDVATSSLLSTPIVGDWLSDEGKSPVIQAPVETHGLLACRTAARTLQSLDYLEEANALWGTAVAKEKDVLALLTPRSDGTPQRLTGGLMRQMGKGWGNGRWGY